MKRSLFLALALASGLALYAAEVTGTWKGSLETAMGPMASTVTFQVDGEKFAGLVKTDLFEAKIENVALNGDRISFITSTDFGVLTYDGIVSGNEMKLHVTGQDGHPLPLNLKKVIL
jgi:hypothetical protein